MSGGMLLVGKSALFAMVVATVYRPLYGQDKGVALNSWEGCRWCPRCSTRGQRRRISAADLLADRNGAFYAHPHMFPERLERRIYCSSWICRVILLMSSRRLAVLFCRQTYLAVGWFWFLGALMPVIGIIQVGTQARADRYTYLPMIGVYLMVVWLLKEVADRWPQSRTRWPPRGRWCCHARRDDFPASELLGR